MTNRLRPGGLLVTCHPLPDRSDLAPVQEIPDASVLYMYRRLDSDDRHLPAERQPDDEGGSLGEYETRAELVARYSQLARALARRFARRGEAIEDLEQVALIALVSAARRFDDAHYDAFAPYATACILGEIKKHFRDRAWAVRVPRSLQETFLAVKRAGDDLTQEISRSPTIPEIATRVGVTEEAVLEAMEASTGYWIQSFDYAGDGGSRMDIPYEEEGYGRAIERLQVEMLSPRLSALERTLIQRIYFEGLTQRQVADDLGCSQMHVSRAVRSALEKLRG